SSSNPAGPGVVQTNDTLTAAASGHDADGDPVTFSYQWLKNGAAIAGATGATLDLSRPGNGDPGDRITVQVTASDGALSSAPATSAEAVVADTAPAVDAVTVSPSAPTTDQLLTAVVSARDADGDPITYAYQWFKNGAAIAGATGATLDLSQP